ncbi:hypothetical protein [Tropicimonas sp. IMCC34043]|uniref:hypothetical protein n=1 Tax=Tropicimonas sp. IMCC34043 TaxID=2248760 RepID=UPI000E251CF5|nr:hypothetical protein [Tropicimonas sp. IMCC34043]
MTGRPTPGQAASNVQAGLDRASHSLPEGTQGHIERLTLRLRPGAGPDEIARALLRALPGARRDGEEPR